MKKRFALLRVDTANYGWVLSLHSTIAGADAAYVRKAKKLPKDALPHLMYRITEEIGRWTKGERVRFPGEGS